MNDSVTHRREQSPDSQLQIQYELQNGGGGGKGGGMFLLILYGTSIRRELSAQTWIFSCRALRVVATTPSGFEQRVFKHGKLKEYQSKY